MVGQIPRVARPWQVDHHDAHCNQRCHGLGVQRHTEGQQRQRSTKKLHKRLQKLLEWYAGLSRHIWKFNIYTHKQVPRIHHVSNNFSPPWYTGRTHNTRHENTEENIDAIGWWISLFIHTVHLPSVNRVELSTCVRFCAESGRACTLIYFMYVKFLTTHSCSCSGDIDRRRRVVTWHATNQVFYLHPLSL